MIGNFELFKARHKGRHAAQEPALTKIYVRCMADSVEDTVMLETYGRQIFGKPCLPKCRRHLSYFFTATFRNRHHTLPLTGYAAQSAVTRIGEKQVGKGNVFQSHFSFLVWGRVSGKDPEAGLENSGPASASSLRCGKGNAVGITLAGAALNKSNIVDGLVIFTIVEFLTANFDLGPGGGGKNGNTLAGRST